MTNSSSGFDAEAGMTRRAVAVTPAAARFGVTTAGAVVAALVGSVAGPVGVVAGTVVGGLFGRGLARLIYPTIDDVFIRQNYWRRP